MKSTLAFLDSADLGLTVRQLAKLACPALGIHTATFYRRLKRLVIAGEIHLEVVGKDNAKRVVKTRNQNAKPKNAKPAKQTRNQCKSGSLTTKLKTTQNQKRETTSLKTTRNRNDATVGNRAVSRQPRASARLRVPTEPSAVEPDRDSSPLRSDSSSPAEQEPSPFQTRLNSSKLTWVDISKLNRSRNAFIDGATDLLEDAYIGRREKNRRHWKSNTGAKRDFREVIKEVILPYMEMEPETSAGDVINRLLDFGEELAAGLKGKFKYLPTRLLRGPYTRGAFPDWIHPDDRGPVESPFPEGALEPEVWMAMPEFSCPKSVYVQGQSWMWLEGEWPGLFKDGWGYLDDERLDYKRAPEAVCTSMPLFDDGALPS